MTNPPPIWEAGDMIKMNVINNIIKGDSIEFEGDLQENISDWKIRAMLCDGEHCIKKATLNSGGSDTQIKITDAENGKFSIYIDAGQTTDFNREPNIEIEVEDIKGKVWTVYQGTVILLPEKITWKTP